MNKFTQIKAKIKAMFTFKGKGYVLDLKSAEIKENKVFLHPADEEITYVIANNENIDILINDGREISENDFRIISAKMTEKQEEITPTIDNPVIEIVPQNEIQVRKENIPNKLNPETSALKQQTNISPYFLKRKMTITLYGDEMELMEQAIKNTGMRRADFIMACLQNSQKKSISKSFNAECKRVKIHRAKHIQEVKDFYEKSVATSSIENFS